MTVNAKFQTYFYMHITYTDRLETAWVWPSWYIKILLLYFAKGFLCNLQYMDNYKNMFITILFTSQDSTAVSVVHFHYHENTSGILILPLHTHHFQYTLISFNAMLLPGMTHETILQLFNMVSSGKVIQSKPPKCVFLPINLLPPYRLSTKPWVFLVIITITLLLDGISHCTCI